MTTQIRKPSFSKETRAKLGKLKVLLVEDQPEVRALVREILADAGVSQIHEAANGQDALEFMDVDFDFINFIICDWNMPNLSGIELLRKVRAAYGNLPFLMITGRGDKDSVMEARDAGVTAFIRKPFSPSQLEEKINVLMRRN